MLPSLPLLLVLLPQSTEATEPAAEPAQPAAHARATAAACDAELVPMHDALTSFGAVASEGWIYVAGGHVGTTHSHSRANLSDAFVRYRADDLAVREDLGAGVALQSVALVAHAGTVWRVGGLAAFNATADEEEDLRSTAVLARYDAQARAWVEGVPLPEPRSSHDAFVVGDVLYAFGGWSLAGAGGEPAWLDHGLALDLAREDAAWRAIEQPFRRRALAVAAARGRIYCIGGLDDAGKTSRRVDVYDPERDAWSLGPELPCDGFGVTAIGRGDELFVAGSDGALYALSDDGARFEPRARLLEAGIFSRLIAVGDGADARLAVLGGAGRGGHRAWAQVLAPGAERREWVGALPAGGVHGVSAAAAAAETPGEGVEEAVADALPWVASARIAFDGEARQRWGAFVVGDSLYLFGGNRRDAGHRFDREDFTAEGWRVDLALARAERVASLPAPRQSMQVAVFPGLSPKAYLVGGFEHDGERSRSSVEVWTYDVEHDAFEVAPATLPVPLTQFAVVRDAARLIALGGLDFEEGRAEAMTHHGRALAWTPGTQEASFVDVGVVLEPARRAFAGGAFGGEAVLVGGFAEGFETLADAVAVDLETGVAREFPAPAGPRVGGSLVEVDGRLFLAGGAVDRGEGLEPNRAIEVYEPEKGAWRVLVEEVPLEDARHVQALGWRDGVVLATTVRGGGVDLVVVRI